jgi:hypothetical protein
MVDRDDIYRQGKSRYRLGVAVYHASIAVYHAGMKGLSRLSQVVPGLRQVLR